MSRKNDDYELMPHSEIAKLKEEIQELRSRQQGSAPQSAQSSENNEAIEQLNKQIGDLLEIFKQTNRELKIGDDEIASRLGKVKEVGDKLDTVIDQNEKIANAVLSIAETTNKLEQQMKQQESSLSLPGLDESAPAPGEDNAADSGDGGSQGALFDSAPPGGQAPAQDTGQGGQMPPPPDQQGPQQPPGQMPPPPGQQGPQQPPGQMPPPPGQQGPQQPPGQMPPPPDQQGQQQPPGQMPPPPGQQGSQQPQGSPPPAPPAPDQGKKSLFGRKQ